MKLITILITYLFYSQISTCTGQKSETKTKIEYDINNERIKLKNYAFCSCLSKNYPNDSLFIKDGSAAAYFELSAYNIEVFEIIDSLTKLYSTKNLPSKYNRPLVIMQCLDFYNSNELKKLIIKLDIEIDTSKLPIRIF